MRRSFSRLGRGLPTALIAGVLAALMLALLGLPSATLAQAGAKVTGEVLYRERIALPPSARVIVQLQDVSMADAAAVVLAEQTIDPQGKGPPYAFELPYDAAKIDSRFSYAVRAQIKDGDTLLFTTTQRYAVITQGNPTSGIQIVVQMIGASQPVSLPAEMLDRDWNLTSLQSASSDIQDISGSKITIRFSADGKVSGSGGCNGFGGAYSAGTNSGLTISNIISTLIACEEPIHTLEQAYFSALQSVSSYALDGTTRLQLSFGNGQGLLGFAIATPTETPEPRPLENACFTETSKCVSGRFLSYWRQNGGLAVFGFPLTDQITENGRPVQYFERQRFELHPENAAPYDVLLGRLGDELLKRQGIDWFTLPKATGAQPGCRFFAETGHNVCDQAGGPSFLRYWSANGLEFDGRNGKSPAESLALFGLPLTEPISATLED